MDPIIMIEMLDGRIQEVGWKHLEKDGENVWISQKGEGNQMMGSAKYVTAVHYHIKPDGQISLPYVMVNLETHPGMGVLDGDTYDSLFYFFSPDGSGRFVKGEGNSWGTPCFSSGDSDNYNIGNIVVKGGWGTDHTKQVREQLARLPDKHVLRAVQGFLQDSYAMSPEEISQILEGEQSLTHRYNKDSVLYQKLMAKAEEKSGRFFCLRRELSEGLSRLVEQDRLE